MLKQCGANDGSLDDGFLVNDRMKCGFKPEQLLCKAGQDSATCLTAPQIQLITKLTQGYINGKGEKMMAGVWEPGALPWGGYNRVFMNPNFNASSAAGQFYGLGVLENPNLDVHTMDVDAAVALADKKFGFINHTSPDLDAFMQRGGKLIMYHGWDDPSISAMNSIEYYDSVVKRIQEKRNLKTNEAALTRDAEVRTVIPRARHATLRWRRGSATNSMRCQLSTSGWISASHRIRLLRRAPNRPSAAPCAPSPRKHGITDPVLARMPATGSAPSANRP